MLTGFGPNADSASAVVTFAYCQGRGKPIHIFQGVQRGRIVSPRGHSGFPFAPCFQPEGSDKTYAEMDKDSKYANSQRSKAVAKLKAFLETQ